MDFDFNLILVPATLILGVIWLLDKLVLKQKKTKGLEKSSAPVRWAYDFSQFWRWCWWCVRLSLSRLTFHHRLWYRPFTQVILLR